MEEHNYIKEYFKSEHDFTTLLNADNTKDNKVVEIKKDINNMQKEIETKNIELHKRIEEMYSKNFSPLNNKTLLKYDSRNYNTYYYDIESGLLCDDITDSIIIDTNKKTDEIYVIVGYNYDYASIIMKKYKYNISKNNDYMTMKMLKEIVIPFFQNTCYELDIMTKEIKENNGYEYLDTLERFNGKDFVDNLYNIDLDISLNIGTLRNYCLNNKSFEIIIKTAPKEIKLDLLKLQYIDNALPIYKIMGISQEVYNKAVDRDMVKLLFDNRDYINGSKNEEYGIEKTENEWFNFIEEVKHYEEDFRFYGIDTYYYSGWNRRNNGNGLLYSLLTSYAESEVFKNSYTFNKYVNYVINETINQGYTRLSNFVDELNDYLTMCKTDNIKPTLYSSYLKQTHDITSRNHNVIVEKEQEEIFKSRYKDFKTYKGTEYCVVAPKNSDDLKVEGDRLNHCVASYIKRVVDGECLIFFLRKEIDESLITFEVRHNTIMQVKGLHNRKPTDNEVKALREFAKYRKMEVNF